MNIALSTDHAGFQASKSLKAYLESLGHICHNFGPANLDNQDDYPDYIFPAAEAVSRGECEIGIIYGGSGQGEAMVANRVVGVRCAVYYGPADAKGAIDADGTPAADDLEILRLSREHNDANMLSLGARFLDWDQIQTAVDVWITTEFSGEDRHVRRIKKIDRIPT